MYYLHTLFLGSGVIGRKTPKQNKKVIKSRFFIFEQYFEFSLKAQLNQGLTSVLVCNIGSALPATTNIVLEVEKVEDSKRGQCFTASTSETRTCAELVVDPAFTKSRCNDQASLKAYLVNIFTGSSIQGHIESCNLLCRLK